MRVLVACEFSGIVRDEFIKTGCEAWSCDLLPSEKKSPFHIQGDVLEVLSGKRKWDILIAFPPCTHLCSSGARWFPEKAKEQKDALNFVLQLAAAPIARIAIENPVGVLSSFWQSPVQIIHCLLYTSDAADE